MDMNKTNLITTYSDRISVAEQNIATYKNLSFKFSMVRLSVFVFSIPILYFILKTTLVVFFTCFILIAIFFLWAVIQQLKYDKLLSEAEAIKIVNTNEIESIVHHRNLYYNGVDYQIHNHAYTEDLDIFGSYSLFGLINRSRTYYGNQILKTFFLYKPNKNEIIDRQEAVEELRNKIDWRQKLAVKLYSLENLQNYNVAEAINKQLSIDMSFVEGKILNFYRQSLPLIWAAIIGLYFFNTGIANTVFTIVFIGNLLLVGNFTKRINAIQGKLSKTSASLKKYLEALETIFSEKWESQLLRKKTSEFENSNEEMPIKSLAELSSLINKLDYRLNFLVAIVANGFILWDLRIVSHLNKWKKNNSGQIDKVFQHIGFIECLSSLATWAYNHPQYNYPLIHDEYLQIEAKGIEHPLIADDQNVDNDFQLLPSDKVSIITGSNMSGKSTFLRTLAINMILGYTGTKTASKAFSMPIVNIVTYMRIKDALEENVSTFKAELNRISMILEVLKTEKDAFILIDEMLRGTNSKDKLSGSIGITKKLLESGTYAMIATHDIKLAELGESDDNIANYFFDIDYKDGDLVFDYKLKKGICENFNASFLLGQLGIDTEEFRDKES
jgi:DNA mismatch repair ATPase MutS